jgi:glyoxylase-like metal-dependent hydrolase (beta-lactamase superfamily II)
VRLTQEVALVGSGAAGFDLTDPLDCHVYLVHGHDGAALVDAGAGRAPEELLDRVAAAGIDPADIRFVLLTHGHADHAGGAAALRRLLPGARILGGGPVPAWLAAGDDTALSVDRGRASGVYPPDYRISACPGVATVRDDDVLDLGGVTLTAVATPGHCDGHTCYLMEGPSGSALFSGDCVFTGGRISLQNLHDARVPEYAAAVARLADLHVDMLLPGHHEVSLAHGGRHVAAADDHFRRGLLPPTAV